MRQKEDNTYTSIESFRKMITIWLQASSTLTFRYSIKSSNPLQIPLQLSGAGYDSEKSRPEPDQKHYRLNKCRQRIDRRKNRDSNQGQGTDYWNFSRLRYWPDTCWRDNSRQWASDRNCNGSFQSRRNSKTGCRKSNQQRRSNQNAQLSAAQAKADLLIKSAEYLKQNRINEAIKAVAKFKAMYNEY